MLLSGALLIGGSWHECIKREDGIKPDQLDRRDTRGHGYDERTRGDLHETVHTVAACVEKLSVGMRPGREYEG